MMESAAAASAAKMGAVAAAKMPFIAKILVMLGFGAAAAAISQLFEGPTTMRARIAHVSAAAFVTMTTAPGVILWLRTSVDWIRIQMADPEPEAWLTVAVPVSVVLGLVAWSALNAAMNLLRIGRERAPEIIAAKLGAGKKPRKRAANG